MSIFGGCRQTYPLQGHVDVASADQIFGWTVAEQLEVLINDATPQPVALTGPRPDCIVAGYEKAQGFHFRPGRFLRDGENRVIVRDAKTKQPLANGTRVIVFDHMKKVDEHWSRQYSEPDHLSTRWWQCPQAVRHVTAKICGSPTDDLLAGMRRWIRTDFPSRLPLPRGVSVGCGNGASELKLVEEGFVAEFDLFELSSHAVDAGRRTAATRGLDKVMHFENADAFARCSTHGVYDVVHWQQALHHMPDVDAALAWSRAMLRPGGLLVMFEYVGATRFQFSQSTLDTNSDFRRSLDPRYLENPRSRGTWLDTELRNIDVDALIAEDPSEAMDSGRILPSLQKWFPAAEVRLLGGAVYHCGLSDILHNLMVDGAEGEIARALALDDDLLARGETQYAAAIAMK